MSEFEAGASGEAPAPRPLSAYWTLGGGALAAGGIAAAVIAAHPDWKKELYVLAGMAGLFGVLQLIAGALRGAGRPRNGVTEVIDDLFAMPPVMRGLAVVQFFSWFGLFALWIYATPAVASFHFGAADPTSAAYNAGANWVNILFSVYNGVAALAAFALPVLAARIGRNQTHAVALLLGAAGLASMAVLRDPNLLLVSMIGVGAAWSSILATPYAILSGALKPAKMGVYMGIFNIFIVVPQMLAATLLGLLLQTLFAGRPIYALALSGGALALAAAASLALPDLADPARTPAPGR